MKSVDFMDQVTISWIQCLKQESVLLLSFLCKVLTLLKVFDVGKFNLAQIKNWEHIYYCPTYQKALISEALKVIKSEKYFKGLRIFGIFRDNIGFFSGWSEKVWCKINQNINVHCAVVVILIIGLFCKKSEILNYSTPLLQKTLAYP